MFAPLPEGCNFVNFNDRKEPVKFKEAVTLINHYFFHDEPIFAY